MQATKAVIHRRILSSEPSSDLPQRIATVYLGPKEYRVYAPAAARGSAVEWLEHSAVRQSDGDAEMNAHPNHHADVINYLKDLPDWQETSLNPESAGGSASQLAYLVGMRDARKVFVVHGRNLDARNALFAFLRAIDLDPIEWDEAVHLTGQGTSYIGQALDAGFSAAQAAIVLLTGDDVARLGSVYIHENDLEDDRNATPQARLNVIFEAGMAFGRYPERTILVQLGKVRVMSDLAGRHILRMSDSPQSRHSLVSRLRTVGCKVETNNRSDWLTAGSFDAAIRDPDVAPLSQ